MAMKTYLIKLQDIVIEANNEDEAYNEANLIIEEGGFIKINYVIAADEDDQS